MSGGRGKQGWDDEGGFVYIASTETDILVAPPFPLTSFTDGQFLTYGCMVGAI